MVYTFNLCGYMVVLVLLRTGLHHCAMRRKETQFSAAKSFTKITLEREIDVLTRGF